MDNLKSRLKDSGFIWGPETHCYGVNGFYTYGPSGKQLKNKVESIFRRIFESNGFFEIETPVLYSTDAWKASGHYKRYKKEMFSTKTSSGVSLNGRPEMATTIFSLLKLLLDNFDNLTPLKIYQVGIALPNDQQTEYQTRTRQYTAHEGHLIFKKDSFDYETVINNLKELAFQLMTSVGISKTGLIFREKLGQEKPFYATRAYALNYKIKGEPELELLGIQYRADYDFAKHSQFSKTKLQINKVYPQDFEISFSSDRPIYVLLKTLFKKDNNRVFLNLPSLITPYSFAILPIEANEENLRISEEISQKITPYFGPTPIFSSGKMSKRYLKADLIGIPYLIIIDKSKKYFLRERDSGKQYPLEINSLYSSLKKYSSYKSLDKTISNLPLKI